MTWPSSPSRCARTPDSSASSAAPIRLATGRENLLLQGRLYGRAKTDVLARSEEIMDVLDLREFADRKVQTYSGGQIRRLDIALGIVHDPQVLFLDEPTTGLDPQNRANLWEHIRRLRERGTTVFLTTHYLEEADALCDRLVIMDHGEVVIGGTPRELKQKVAGDAVVITPRDHDPEKVAELACRSRTYGRARSRRATPCGSTSKTAPPRCPSCCACWTEPVSASRR